VPRDPIEPSIVSAYGLQEVVDSGSQYVREDERFITETFGPFILSSGETVEILDSKEKGQIVYVQVVADNPYVQTLLQLDDYRNKEPRGETVGELLYATRTNTDSEGSFYATDNGSDGGFVLTYNPSSPEGYDYRIKLTINNPLRISAAPFGNDTNFTIPGVSTPASLDFLGGGSFTHPMMEGMTLDQISNLMARPIGVDGYAVDKIPNLAAIQSNSADLSLGNPFTGRAGKPFFRRQLSVVNSPLRSEVVVNGQEVIAKEGSSSPAVTKVLFGTQANNATLSAGANDVSNYPYGSMDITFSSENEANGVVTDFAVGDRVFIRDGSTIYFPGVVTATANVNGGGSGTKNKITVAPGLPFTPSKISCAVDSETQTFGQVATLANVNPEIVVRKVIVKRRKLVSYDG
jgi:hypothetical protein